MNAPLTTETITWWGRHEFLLRRMHSLSGIVPVGAFLVEHLLTNSYAWLGHMRYNEAVAWLQHLPYLLALEIFLIFIPLAFHGLYGLVLALASRPNPFAYTYMANQRYTWQRITGYIVFVFLIVHLLHYRFAYLVGDAPFTLANPTTAGYDYFLTTKAGMFAWSVFGILVPVWLLVPLYVIGTTAAVFHLANGIWKFASTWGITAGIESQNWFIYPCAAVGTVLLAWGYLSLLGLVWPGAGG